MKFTILFVLFMLAVRVFAEAEETSCSNEERRRMLRERCGRNKRNGYYDYLHENSIGKPAELLATDIELESGPDGGAILITKRNQIKYCCKPDKDKCYFVC